jgi:hypothetical protein
MAPVRGRRNYIKYLQAHDDCKQTSAFAALDAQTKELGVVLWAVYRLTRRQCTFVRHQGALGLT